MQSLGLHPGKIRQECNHVVQHYTAQGVQRNLLSAGGTLRTVLGNKEEREKKTENVDRATKLSSLLYDYTHQQRPHLLPDISLQKLPFVSFWKVF